MEEEKPSAKRLHGSYSAPHDAIGAGAESGEMWIDVTEEDARGRRLAMDAEIDAEADALFYGAFPSLADFPSISQSSSSSLSAGGAVSTASCSSSSSSARAPSWPKADPDENSCEKSLLTAGKDVQMAEPPRPLPPPPRQLSLPAMQEEEGDGMGVLEDISDMELLDSSGMWDPSSLFTAGDEDEKPPQQRPQLAQLPLEDEDEEGEGKRRPSDDLAMVFFEWLKSNKEAISPEELRSIRLKRSTIECAAKRLGGGKEGMKQLLKLILAWVQNHHLQKRKNMNIVSCGGDGDYLQQQQQQPLPLQVQFPVGNTWGSPQMAGGYLPDPMLPQPASQLHPQMMVGFAAVGSENGYGGAYSSSMMLPPLPSSGCGDYPMIDGNLGWGMNFGGGYGVNDGQYGGKFGGFAGQHGVLGEPLMRMTPSATKEARKKRMARQRRIFSHHHHHHRHHHNNHNHQNQQHHHQVHHHSANGPAVEHQSATLASNGSCTMANPTSGSSSGNWVMWPSSSAAASTSPPRTTMLSPSDGDPQPSQQRQMGLDRRQGWKPEKNLRFLLQKVLKQSDVGNLGRIVLPKKEAETHLPELEARDGIAIAMEDIGTSRIWNMRYRFWPNNKSRMYLLENTGDFVRSNGLQEGDFIVIYSDTKCGKYLIRGVKVRKQEAKADQAKNIVKTPRASSSNAASKLDGSSLALPCDR